MGLVRFQPSRRSAGPPEYKEFDIQASGSTSNDGNYVVAVSTTLTLTVSGQGELVAETMSTGTLTIINGIAELDVFNGWLNKLQQPFDHSYNKSIGDPTSHIWDGSGDPTPPSYAILVVDDSDGSGSTFEYYYGCVLSEIEISVEEGEVVMFTLNFERKGTNLDGSELGTTPVYGDYPSSISYILWSDVTITKEIGSGWASTGALTNVSSFSATITQNAEKKFRISGADEPVGIDLVGFEVSGSLDFDYDNLDEADEITGDLRGDLVLVFGSAGQIDFDVVTFEGFPMDASPDELMTASVDFTCDTVTFGYI